MESSDSEESHGLIDSIFYSFTFVHFADVNSDQFTNFVILDKESKSKTSLMNILMHV